MILKICSRCGKPSRLWKSNPKLCKACAEKVRATETEKEAPVRTSINKLSDKQAKLKQAYLALRRVFLKEHPLCEVCATGYCQRKAQDIHHSKGRGEYLLDTTTWIATCRPCHVWIESHVEEAKQKGFSENRLDKHE